MNARPDSELLREYAAQHSEAAFREIVERYSDLVYCAALRQLGSPDLAHDISQSVFSELARKARSLAASLKDRASLTGWLYCATRYAALAHIRNERRRHAREREAMESLNTIPEAPTQWEQVGPLLDEAMASLSEDDREALLLRFFRNLDFRSVGTALGVSDDTAQKRVTRSLERLRAYLSRRDVGTSAAALATMLSANAIQAGPVGLVATLTSASLASAAAGGSASAAILQVLAAPKLKAGIIGGIISVSAVTSLVIQNRMNAQVRRTEAALQQTTVQFAQAQAENQRLAQLPRQQPNNLEALAKLRDEVTALRSQAATISPLQDQRQQWVARLNLARQRPDPNVWQPPGLLEESADRTSYAKELGLAVLGYAADHQQRMPASLDQVASLFKPTGNQTNFTLGQFELVYHGTRSALTNYAHPGAILLLREKQPWKTAKGHWAKVYVNCDGSGVALSAADGNFEDWENKHIAPPEPPRQ